jgi:hypothetical protein
MTITIEINPETEKQLQYAAARAGVAPEAYIVGLLQQNLRRATQRHKADRSLPRQEAELLRKINRSLSQIQWERYDQLVGKRRAETLTPDELNELIASSDQIEAANVRRIKYMAELAQLRGTTVSALMTDIGMRSRPNP